MKQDHSADNFWVTRTEWHHPVPIKDIQEISNNIHRVPLSKASLVFFEHILINLDNDWAINYR